MKINIGVIFGGRSVEHEISVISALQAIDSFEKNRYELIPIYITKNGIWYTGKELLNIENYKNIEHLLGNCTEIYISPNYGDAFIYKKQKSIWKNEVISKLDLVIPILHGSNGEDGTLQGLIELKGLPFVGCDVLGSAVGMDKIITKMVLKESGIPVVDYIWFSDKNWYTGNEEILNKIKQIGFPVIVKPANLGSSVGISKAASESELADAIELAGSYSSRLLVEKMIVNLKEINCSVLGDSESQLASVCEEPIRSSDILSYQDKYLSKGNSSKGMSSTQRQIPALIPENMAKDIQSLAKKTFKVLGSSGVARIDFLVDTKSEKIFVNEINSIPGSLAFYLWEAGGKSFTELLNDLVDLAFKRQREKENYIISYNENIFNMSTGSLKLDKA